MPNLTRYYIISFTSVRHVYILALFIQVEFIQLQFSMYCGTSVFKLNLFVKAVHGTKCSKTKRIFPLGINVKWISSFLPQMSAYINFYIITLCKSSHTKLMKIIKSNKTCN